MKYCTNCGTQLPDEAYVCNQCGTAQGQAPVQQNYAPPQGYVPPQQAYAPRKESGLATAAKVFMILGTVFMGLYIIPLAWCLPMTITYCNKLKRGEPIGTGFKVCSLLFVSLLGGIFMLCDKND